MTLRSTKNRQLGNTLKIETTHGAIFVHIDTDRPCLITDFHVATPQKLENTSLYQFISQLEYEGEGV